MTDGGFLLALPTQSVAVRLILGALAAVLIARGLLRAGLRVPRLRVAAALVPMAAIVTILVVSLGDYRLPTLMIPTGGGGSVLLSIENSYAYLAPMALPALLGLWAVIALGRVARRIHSTVRVSRRAGSAIAAGEVPLEIRRSVHRVASRMGLDVPPVGVLSDCPGGASVVGIRRPVIALDAELVASLDEQELEGVIAHELAHIRRRDNLMALMLGITRDAAFFVPGGRWALRQLLIEREIAADQLAVENTGRPGALAAGLLKVLEGVAGPRGAEACAALLPEGTLVRRVEHLVDDRPAPTRTRMGGEVLTLSTAFLVVVVLATGLPRLLAGADPDGGLGVLVTAPGNSTTPSTEVEVLPRVFTTYHGSAAITTPSRLDETSDLDDDPDEVRRSTLAACAVDAMQCAPRPERQTMGLRPQPEVEVDEDLTARWRARQVVETGEMLRLYWLQTLR